jgi:deoxyadenosine/deoxycytidine kinase
MKNEYQDYGEYLEDVYEEWCDLLEEQYEIGINSAQYGPPSNRLTITQHNGQLKARWNREGSK